MSDENKSTLQWLGGLSGLILMGWLVWMSSAILELKANAASIPLPVETALQELRYRLNADQVERAKLVETAIGNAKDIGYLRERLPKQ